MYLGRNLNRATRIPGYAATGDALVLDGRERANPAAARAGDVPDGVYAITKTSGRPPHDVDFWGVPESEQPSHARLVRLLLKAKYRIVIEDEEGEKHSYSGDYAQLVTHLEDLMRNLDMFKILVFSANAGRWYMGTFFVVQDTGDDPTIADHTNNRFCQDYFRRVVGND